MKGKLVDLATMEKEAYTAARVARDKLLSMPDRLGPHMLGKSDLQEVKDIIRKEVTAALDNLTDFFRKRVQSR